MRKTLLVTAFAALALTATACGGTVEARSASDLTSFVARGVFLIPSESLTGTPARSAEDCGGQPGYGYNDLYVGTSVKVQNADGKLVATTTLSAVTLDADGRCRFSFITPEIPRGQGPYEWQVTKRGWIPFNESEAGDLAGHLDG